MRALFLFLATSVVSSASTVPLEAAKLSESWTLPGGMKCAIIPAGKQWDIPVTVPALTEREVSVPGDWRAIVSIDAYGSLSGASSALSVEAIEAKTGEAFCSSMSQIQEKPPRAAISLDFSSSQGGEAGVRNAFDGKPETTWHSSWDQKTHPAPHHIGIAFGSPQLVSGIHYVPRIEGYNGRAREYRIEVSSQGKWETVATGPAEGIKTTDVRDIDFPAPRAIEGYRIVITKDDGEGFGSVGELTPKGMKLEFKEESTPLPASRAWLEIPKPQLTFLTGKTFLLRLKNQGKADVVVAVPEMARVHSAPNGKLFGRSNGGTGPDQLGCGLLGFNAMTEDQQRVLTVMDLIPGGAAKKAGLKPGDAIVAVSGKPLPVNDLSPGWNWFRLSHEAFIGRATEAALRDRKDTLVLTVMREGKPQDLAIPLARDQAFTNLDPASDPQAAELLDDMISFLEKTQREDGSWSGDIIRTTFSALALMATEKPAHLKRVRRAIDWSLAKYPKPESYGNLGFWSGGYAGTLYAEWFLRTGDKRVITPMEELRDWAIAGQHNSKWDVPALGHGPDGLPYDQKALIAPAAHLIVAEALAKRCGVKSGIWELLTPYIVMTWSDPKEGGHGAMGYNQSYKDTEEFWGRSGLCSIACHLRGERSDMRDAMTRFMVGHHPWFRNSHAYGEPGGAWGFLGLNLANPAGFDEVFPQYAWWFSLAWEPGYGLRFTTPHMGAPYMGEDDLINATYALVLQAKKRSLHLTGKR